MRFYFIVLMLSLYVFPVMAQDFGQNDAPIEISADTTLEWLQKEKQYVANGNVEIIQGENKIYADKIIADYHENETSGKTEIWQINAFENVRLENKDNKAFANKAVYNFDSGSAILTGGDLKLTNPQQTITATQKLEYNLNTGTAKAVGNALITRATDSLKAQSITAQFIKNAKGKQVLKTASAHGNVRIKTKEETITGDKATYNALANKADMNGNVKITRGANTLEGARAQVNLTTNVSKIFGAPEKNKRVKGVFFPSSRKSIPALNDKNESGE